MSQLASAMILSPSGLPRKSYILAQPQKPKLTRLPSITQCHSGKKLHIVASGTFARDVEPGAKVFIQVKYGLITLIKQEADLCDAIGNVDLSCPLKQGPMNLTKEVDIPQQVPKGKYSVIADVTTVDGDRVTCMDSVVYF